ncbi:MAG: DUF2330 domain-containing protein, partial [Myxococcales bacterium]|nr:DUF2330 domain-containing protein [Myxococcales bacterium]
MKTLALAASLAVAFTAGPALACGGLFCDSAQPVTQAAERILFARDGDRVVMHVRLTWAGPPTDFGWLLPVPPDVETALSSQDLFGYLEAFAPRFRLDTEFVDCDVGFDGSGGSGGGAGGDFGGGGAGGAGVDFPEVSVLSREPIGPYDRTILQGASVEAVVDWLERNGYQVPEGAEE